MRIKMQRYAVATPTESHLQLRDSFSYMYDCLRVNCTQKRPWPRTTPIADWFSRTRWGTGWVLHINTVHFPVISIQARCLWLPLIPFPGCQTALLDYLSLRWCKFPSPEELVPAIFCIHCHEVEGEARPIVSPECESSPVPVFAP